MSKLEILSPTYKILTNEETQLDEKFNILIQFFRTNDFDSDFISSICADSVLPDFVLQMFSVFYQLQFDEELISTNTDFSEPFFDFIYRLGTKNQFLRDTIAANANFSELIEIIYENINTENVSQIDSHSLVPTLKLFAVLSSSPSLTFSDTDAMDILFPILFKTLDDQRSSSWAASIISFLCHYHEHISNYLKSQEYILDLNKKLTKMLSSNDSYAVISALSAETVLFSTVEHEANINMRCAISFISQSSPFLIQSQLASIVILILAEKVDLDERELKTILQATVEVDTEMDSYIIITTLTSLVQYHSAIIRHIKDTKFLIQYLRMILYTSDVYLIVSACYLLRLLEEFDEDLLAIDFDNDIVSEYLTAIKDSNEQTPPEKIEALLIICRSLMCNRELSSKESLLVHDLESPIFTNFIRAIEQNNAYCCICYYLFIEECCELFPNWKDRVVQTIVDVPFIPLVLSVLNTSSNEFSTRDSFAVLHDMMSISDHLFESLVHTQVALNRKRQELSEKNIKENHISTQQLQAKITQQAKEIEELKNNYDTLLSETDTTKFEEIEKQNSEFKENASNLTKENNTLKIHVAALAMELDEVKKERDHLASLIGSTELTVAQLQDKNTDLTKQIELLNNSLKSKDQLIFDLKTSNHSQKLEILYLQKELKMRNKENDNARQQAMKVDRDLIAANKSIVKQRKANKKLILAIEKVREALNDEETKKNELQMEYDKLEIRYKSENEQREKLREQYLKLKKLNHLIIQRICDIDNDKNKWEVIAKFSHCLQESTREAQNEVYNPLY